MLSAGRWATGALSASAPSIVREKPKRLYSVGTWDNELGRFTPEASDTLNVDWCGLRRILRRLRKAGYSANKGTDDGRMAD